MSGNGAPPYLRGVHGANVADKRANYRSCSAYACLNAGIRRSMPRSEINATQRRITPHTLPTPAAMVCGDAADGRCADMPHLSYGACHLHYRALASWAFAKNSW